MTSSLPESFPTIGVVGLSHLGLVWSMGYAHLGFNVIGFDTDKETVSSLNRHVIPLEEPGLEELLKKHHSQLAFTHDPAALGQCPVIYFARDVPMDEEGNIDLSEIDALLDAVIPCLPRHVEFIFMGQVPVGYTRKLSGKIRKRRPDLPFNLTYCVEIVSLGTAIDNFLHRDYTLLGVADPDKEQSAPLVRKVLEPFGAKLLCVSYESAELMKGARNILMASHLSFVNTLADYCEKLGARIHEVTSGMKLDKKFSPHSPWRAGLGFAGGHFERDLSTWIRLAEENGLNAGFLKSIVKYNKERHAWLDQALKRHVFSTASEKPVIALWGLSYKKGTDSTHNSHALRIIRRYSHQADLRVFDPVARLPKSVVGVRIYEDKLDALRGADCLIILTEWEEFALPDATPLLEYMRRPVVIDCVNILPQKMVEGGGLVRVVAGEPLAL
ncbi:MAG: UDP-glucose/GDP-mannose dehydrogenase family protein [Deltaproteobacteria bacterium]|nr:UDP-glucose/GDP-mannose dehydrogenase family protein [Deltaproteobacteria bacterium]